MIKFKICGQDLTAEYPKIASETIDFLEADFSFSDEWIGLSKWCHFNKGDTVYDIHINNDRIEKDMHMNLSKGIWEVYIHGDMEVSGKVVQRITTVICHIYVDASGLMNGEPFPTVTPSAGEQIIAQAVAARDAAKAYSDAAEENAAAASASKSAAASFASSAEEAKNLASASAATASEKATAAEQSAQAAMQSASECAEQAQTASAAASMAVSAKETAITEADNAAASASSAQSSAQAASAATSTASAYASAASDCANAASASAQNASNSADSAAVSAASASASMDAAAESERNASEYANAAESDVIKVISLSGNTVELTLANNTEYRCTDPVTSVALNGFTAGNAAKAEQWGIVFTAGDSITVSVPVSLKWAVAEPVFTAGSTYWISVVPFGDQYLAVWTEATADEQATS